MINQFKAMAVFRAVVETGTFRGAAKALNLSPSVISHHITQLEANLGTALLYRSTRKISLTSDGHRLFDASTKMVEAAQTGLDAIRSRAEQPSGRLKVAVTGAVFENPPYVDHITAFAKAHPKVDLSVSFSDQKIELIGSVFDAAVRIGWLDDSRYKTRKLCDIGRALVASQDYLQGRKPPKIVEDLETFDWIKLAQLPVNRQLINKSGDVPTIRPRIAIEVDSAAALRRMALAGMGVVAIPRVLVASDIIDGRLIELKPRWDLMAAAAYAVWPNNVSETSLTIRFVNFLAKELKAR
jgi:DNA-binding transcriptional LysR family regulator